MKPDLTRYLFYVGLLILVFSSGRGCTPGAGDSLYTGSTFGPGAVASAKGLLHELNGGDNEPWAELRIREQSLRVRRPDTTPVGRIRVQHDGWEYLQREGTARCTGQDLPAEPGDQHPATTLSVQCGDQRWEVEADDGALHLRGPNGDTRTLFATAHDESLGSAIQPWGAAARALLFDAADQRLALDAPEFEAQLLLAWLARSWDVTVDTQSAESSDEAVDNDESGEASAPNEEDASPPAGDGDDAPTRAQNLDEDSSRANEPSSQK